ncbi:hypothetical protein BBJ28_00025845 [Nothophytophthora sp. Chile5]|nr:hypothetical protein BBJ28_00025845 [Nothophytophthora sp. Chile5]
MCTRDSRRRGDEALDFATSSMDDAIMETLETGDLVFFRRELSALHTWVTRRPLNSRFDHCCTASLNNVAIGATHARASVTVDLQGSGAGLDWDTHHGNGTEELLLKDDPTPSSRTGKSCETSDLVNVALENMGAGADSSSGSQAFRSALENMVLRP